MKPSTVQLDLVPGAELVERRRLTPAQERAAYALRACARVRANASGRTLEAPPAEPPAARLDRKHRANPLDPTQPVPDLPAHPRAPPLMVLTGCDVPALLLCRGEWCRAFASVEAAQAWAARNGWKVRP